MEKSCHGTLQLSRPYVHYTCDRRPGLEAEPLGTFLAIPTHGWSHTLRPRSAGGPRSRAGVVVNAYRLLLSPGMCEERRAVRDDSKKVITAVPLVVPGGG
ncbi:hypothetical protein J6590_016080 [Homalodisca vitripennis]|nr:hypothetical protein J6590_016080 [Homalodisca vitripennis]